MKLRTFFLDTQRVIEKEKGAAAAIEKLAIRRAISDDAVGVVCVWDAEATVNPANKKDFTNPQVKGLTCDGSAEAVRWGDSHLLDDVIFNTRITVSFDDAAGRVVERLASTTNGVYSYYQRVWKQGGEVCLSTAEGKVNAAPYLEKNFGCHRMPDNAYVQRLLANAKAKGVDLQK